MVHKRLIVHLMAREFGKRFYGPNKNQYQNQSTGKIEILKVEKSLKKSTDQKSFLKTGQSRHANGRVPIEVHPKGQFFA